VSQANPTLVEATTYAENYIIYGEQTQAWRAAFPNSKAGQKAAHEKASVFHKIGKVQKRIEELRNIAKKQSEEEFSLTAGKIKQMLTTAAAKGLRDKVDQQGNKVPVSIPGAVSALSEINKMDGNHAPTKLGIGGDPDAPPVQTSDLTDEQLQAELAKYGLKPENS